MYQEHSFPLINILAWGFAGLALGVGAALIKASRDLMPLGTSINKYLAEDAYILLKNNHKRLFDNSDFYAPEELKQTLNSQTMTSLHKKTNLSIPFRYMEEIIKNVKQFDHTKIRGAENVVNMDTPNVNAALNSNDLDVVDNNWEEILKTYTSMHEKIQKLEIPKETPPLAPEIIVEQTRREGVKNNHRREIKKRYASGGAILGFIFGATGKAILEKLSDGK